MMKKESDTQPSGELEIVVVKSFEEIEAIREIWEQMQAAKPYPEINADIDRYLSVIKTRTQDVQPYIMLIKQNGALVSMVIGQLKNTRIKCNLGRKTIFNPNLKTLWIVYGGILGNPTEEICSMLIRELIKALHQRTFDVVYFNYLGTDSVMYRLARKLPSIHCRNYRSKVEVHWCLSVPQNIDEFLQSCSKKRRQNLLRCVKKLEKEFPGQVRMVTYSKESEVELAINNASQISSLTYQCAFGGGINNDDATLKDFSSLAKKGWFRMHILYIKDEPCAFRYRLKYRGTYFAEAIGYSPKWKSFSVGHVLFYKVMEEICNDPTVHRLDFGHGDGYHKQWDKMNFWKELKTEATISN